MLWRAREWWGRDVGVWGGVGDVLGPANPKTGFSHKSWISVFPLQSGGNVFQSAALLLAGERPTDRAASCKADATAPPAGSRPDQVCICIDLCLCVCYAVGVNKSECSWHWEVFCKVQSKGDNAKDKWKETWTTFILFTVGATLINSCRGLWSVMMLNLTASREKKHVLVY